MRLTTGFIFYLSLELSSVTVYPAACDAGADNFSAVFGELPKCTRSPPNLGFTLVDSAWRRAAPQKPFMVVNYGE